MGGWEGGLGSEHLTLVFGGGRQPQHIERESDDDDRDNSDASKLRKRVGPRAQDTGWNDEEAGR